LGRPDGEYLGRLWHHFADAAKKAVDIFPICSKIINSRPNLSGVQQPSPNVVFFNDRDLSGPRWGRPQRRIFLGGWCANHQSANPQRAKDVHQQNEKPGLGLLPPKAWGLHQGVYDYPEKAKFGTTQGG
jgi:hypothetical protein